MATKLTLTQFKNRFSSTLNSVGYGSEVVILQRNNKNFLAVAPLSALSAACLERLGIKDAAQVGVSVVTPTEESH